MQLLKGDWKFWRLSWPCSALQTAPAINFKCCKGVLDLQPGPDLEER